MSRIDHIIARRMESERPQQERLVVTSQVGGVRIWAKQKTAAQHKQGSPWWRGKFADLVERRRGATKTKDPIVRRSLAESLARSTKLTGGAS